MPLAEGLYLFLEEIWGNYQFEGLPVYQPIL